MTTEERLEKLEAEHAQTQMELFRAKRTCRWVLSMLGLTTTAFGLWLLLRNTVWAQGAQPSLGDARVIRADKFVIEDKNHKERVVLEAKDDGMAGVFVLDETGMARIKLVQDKHLAAVAVLDEAGEGGVGLAEQKHSAIVTVADKAGKVRAEVSCNEDGPRVRLADEAGKTRAYLVQREDGPHVGLADADGKRIWGRP